MNLSRILGCVGAVTLCVVACNDKDISLISPDAGLGGSSNAGSGGSSGNGGSAGSAGSGGGGGSAGGTNAGSGGMAGSAGSAGMDPDAGDSGTPAGPYAEICANYCAARTAWAAATGDAGVNCPGFVATGCESACEEEIAIQVDLGCAATPAAFECHATANVWYCPDGSSVLPNNCEAAFTADDNGFYCGTNCDTTCNPQAGAANACLFGAPLCGT